MNYLKSIGIELLIIGLVIILFLSYIFSVKKKAKSEGKIEQVLENLVQQQKTLKAARLARREFGTTVEELEDNDHAQFKNRQNYKNVQIKNISNELYCIECVQYGKSPFRRNR